MSLLGGGGGASKARVTMSFYMTFFYFDGVPYAINRIPESFDFFSSIFLKELISWAHFQIFTAHQNTSNGKLDMMNRLFSHLLILKSFLG